MRTLPARFEPARVEEQSRQFWKDRGWPASGPSLGPLNGPPVLELLTAFAAPDGLLGAIHRVVLADVAARHRLRAGGRTLVPLMTRGEEGESAELTPAFRHLGIWVGGGEPTASRTGTSPARIGPMVERLARMQVLVGRRGPMRTCPGCRTPRTPQTIVYAEREGPSYLVRFRLTGELSGTDLLVSTDAAWKLLGATALAVHPQRMYARARVRRRDREETILVDRGALDRVGDWLEGATAEFLDERPGSAMNGLRYEHPLATEFPVLKSLPAPAGTVVLAEAVADRGTGVVPIVPFHGPADYAIGQSLGLSGWPVVGVTGELTAELAHKYVGLPLDNAEAFVLRDLQEGGAIFAELRQGRGVPFCAFCGREMFWYPGRAWCLDLTHLPPETLDRLGRLLPAPWTLPLDPTLPWPATGWGDVATDRSVALAECAECGRLYPPPGPPACACGGAVAVVHREPLAAFAEALAGWDALAPVPTGAAVRMFIPGRNLAPTLVHLLVGMTAANAAADDLRVVAVPTVPAPDDFSADGPQDALRATLVRLAAAPAAGEAGWAGRRQQEERRLRRLWALAVDLLDRMLTDRYAESPPLTADLSGLMEEDRGILARFDRLRTEVLRAYDRDEAATAHRLLWRFLERDLRQEYLPVAAPRLAREGLPSSKRAAYQTIVELLDGWAMLYAPIAPFTTEAIHRAFRGDGESLFAPTDLAGTLNLRDDVSDRFLTLAASLQGALGGYARAEGDSGTGPFAEVHLLLTDDALASQLSTREEGLRRILGCRRLVIASPARPWSERQVSVRPVAAEVQRSYPAQAGRILRILEGMPADRLRQARGPSGLHIALEGTSVAILPPMVEVSDSIPPNLAPVRWELGELYVARPPGSEGGRRLPPLSSDGLHLLDRIRRWIDSSVAPSAVDRVVIVTADPLGAELRRYEGEVSAYLDGRTVELPSTPEGLVPGETFDGRGARGHPWVVWLPGLVRRPRVGGAAARVRRGRQRRSATETEADLSDVLSEDRRTRDTTIRETVEAFDRELGRPLVGPAKLSAAWEAGLQSFDAVAHAPYAQLAALPGFGPVVARHLVEHFGGALPPKILRARRDVAIATSDSLTPTQDPPQAPIATGASQEPAAPEGPLAPRSVPGGIEPAAPATPPSAVPLVSLAPVPSTAPPAAIAVRPTTPVPVTPTVVVVTPPEPTAPAAPPGPAPGIELWPGVSVEAPWLAFLEATGAGHRGVCISREFPDRVRAYLGSREVEVFWLSNIGRDRSLRPGDLEGLLETLRRQLRERSVTAVYLDGVEYLLRVHGLAKVRRFLDDLHSETQVHDARVWVPLNPSLIESGSLTELEAAFRLHREAGVG